MHRAFVIQARGDVVVEVELQSGGDPTAAGVVLQAQIERQAAVEGLS